jgi:hypothetical protein
MDDDQLDMEIEDDDYSVMQEMINSGQVWKMEGSMGREAMSLLKAGLCILGEEGHSDYYGNYVPSRTEVQAGTLGSQEYADKMQEVGS